MRHKINQRPRERRNWRAVDMLVLMVLVLRAQYARAEWRQTHTRCKPGSPGKIWGDESMIQNAGGAAATTPQQRRGQGEGLHKTHCYCVLLHAVRSGRERTESPLQRRLRRCVEHSLRGWNGVDGEVPAGEVLWQLCGRQVGAVRGAGTKNRLSTAVPGPSQPSAPATAWMACLAGKPGRPAQGRPAPAPTHAPCSTRSAGERWMSDERCASLPGSPVNSMCIRLP